MESTDFYFQSPSGNLFNKVWYKETYNLNIDEDKLGAHYFNVGYKMNYNPSLYFNTKWYKEKYNIPDQICPLVHFCENVGKANLKPNEKCKYFITDMGFPSWAIIPKHDFIPLHNECKRINLLLPGEGLSAGPATLFIFANILAKYNFKVRIITIFSLCSKIFRDSMKERFGMSNTIEYDSLLDHDVRISYDDIFITSAWWTVYPLKFILGYLNVKKFIWFIQENELLLHAGDETYAKALSCYNMDYYSLINTSILFDDLKKVLFPFTDEKYCKENCVCFEPAFDTTKLKYIEKPDRKNLKIIFYSRDANIAKRNCVKLVNNLIYELFQDRILSKNDKVFGFGQKKGVIQLSNGFYYEELGFLNLDEYYKLLNEADILISFQMAPHPSYPPFEMSFCNGVTLHTNFSNKNQKTISRYTDKIIMSEPHINHLLNGMETAIKKVKENNISREPPKLLNNDWNIALEKCYEFITNKFVLPKNT